eukprot:m.89572 g.89572  ORF g.89572 m.89572 type:complete len:489 (+) comp21528_c1_seq1:1300-2766(+)
MAEKVLEWSLGFKSHTSGKYLTQETFGFAINCNGPSLKKKQTFFLESGEGGAVHIRTHLGRYLVGLADGTFKGDAENKGPDTQWTIEPQVDGTWALKSAHGFYAHGEAEKLSAFTKELPADGKWVVHLAMHPQVNIFNVMRKRWLHLNEGQIQCNEDIPWGSDAVINFIFFADHPDGRYGLMTSDGKYLSANGRLEETPTPACQFLLGFHDDQISFRDANGCYLSCIGGKGVVKTNKDKITKDELFVLQDSEPQFTIQDYRGKYLSVRASVEVKCDQKDVQDTERWQFELDAGSQENQGYLVGSNVKYLTVGDGDVLQATGAKGPDALLTIVWEKNRVKFKASNGKFVCVQSNGGMKAVSADGSEEGCTFLWSLINRDTLLLRGQYGFVGLKGNSGRVEVNKSTGEIFDVICKDGAYSFRSRTLGKYWAVDQDGVHTNSATPVPFYLEFPLQTHVMIKTEDGAYLEGEQNGGFKATGKGSSKNTLWEY